MKKTILLILAALIAASSCACGSTDERPSNDDSSVVVLESSSFEESSDAEASGDTSEEQFVESENVEKINSWLSYDIDRNLKAKNIFSKRKYTYSRATNDTYTDNDFTKLTDGVVRDLFDKYNWVAFTGGGNVEILFDMGGNDHRLATVEVESLNQVSYGIHLPSSVLLSVSDDGENFTEIASISAPTDINASSKYTYRFALPKATSARYIKITAVKADGGFFFVDEIFGYEYSEDGTIDINRGEVATSSEGLYDYYNYQLSTDVLVPVSSSDKDFDTYQNLAALNGVNIQIKHFDPMSLDIAESNSPISEWEKFVDGKKAAEAIYQDSAWFKFSRGYGRHIDIDLGNLMSVKEFKAGFLNQVTVGVGTPPAVNISLSENGTDWYCVYGNTTIKYGDESNNCIYRLEADFGGEYKARYVRLTFATVPFNNASCMVYIDEIEIYGKKCTTSAVSASTAPRQTMGNYPDPAQFGVKAITLSGIGNIGSTSGPVPLSEASARKCYGKYDENGNVTDVFFDSFCFAPANAFEKIGDPKKDGVKFVDELFTDGYNLSELNKAVAYVNEKLGMDSKATYWINLSCMGNRAKSADELYDVLKYQVDYALEKMKTTSLPNLKFVGFYYNDEYIARETEDITVEALSRLNEYLHGMDLMSLWCPYYSAYGIWRWAEAGFDIACLQPNYMFYATESTRLKTCAEIAKLYGMCVELEIEEIDNEEACALYREYLREGVISGYMNSVQMYYGVIHSAYGSKKEYTSAVYDDSYKYSHDLLEENYNIPDAVDMSGLPESIDIEVKNGKSVSFEMGDIALLNYRFVQTPIFGRIRLNIGGKGSYRAMSGYCGNDTVAVELSDNAGNRRIIYINITVTE